MKNIYIIIPLLLGIINYTQAQVSIDKQVNMNDIFLDGGNPFQEIEFTLIVSNQSTCRIAFEVTDNVLDANGSGIAPDINNLDGPGSISASFMGSVVTWQDSLLAGQYDTLIIRATFDATIFPMPGGSFVYKNRAVGNFNYKCCEDILANGDSADDYLCDSPCDSLLTDTIPSNDVLCQSLCDSLLTDTIPSNDILCAWTPTDGNIDDEEEIIINYDNCWMLPLPVVEITSSNSTLTCFEPTATLTANTFNDPDIIFNWSTGETTQSITISNAGTYILTAYDWFGCHVVFDDIVITEDFIAPTINTTLSTEVNCISLGSAEVIASSNFGQLDYIWDMPNPTFNNGAGIQVFNGGEYFVTVTDMNNGCTTETSVIVLENTMSPVINTSVTTYVLDDANPTSDISITSSTSSEYEWNTGETTSSINVNAGGIYSVTVTDINNGCTTVDETTIIEDFVDCSSANIQVAMIPQGNAVLTCDINSEMIVAEVFPAGTYTYEWSDMNSNSETNTYFATGTYYVTVTDENGCTEVGEITITADHTPPSISVSVSNYMLDTSNPTSTITVNPTSPSVNLNYQWNTGATTPSITVNTSGVYTVEITDQINGCSVLESVAIREDSSTPSSCQEFMIEGGDIFANYFYNASYVAGQNAYYAIDNATDPLGGSHSRLLKFNAEGDLIWSKNYAFVNDFVETQNGDLILACQTVIGGGTNADIRLTRIDSDANIIWTKIIRTSGSVRQRPEIHQVGNDKYTVSCWLDPNGGITDDIYLNQIDGAGNMLWTKSISIGSDDQMMSRNVAPNGDMLLTGYETGGTVFIIRVDINGSISQEIYFDTDNLNPLLIQGIEESPDGGYAIIMTDNQSTNQYIIKLDSGGSQEWGYSLGLGNRNIGSISLRGNEIMVSFRDLIAPFDKTNLLIFDLVGNLIFSKRTNNEFAVAIQFSNNGIMVEGENSSTQNGLFGYFCSLESMCFMEDENISTTNFSIIPKTANATIQNISVTHPVLNSNFSDITISLESICEFCDYRITDTTIGCDSNVHTSGNPLTCISLEINQAVNAGVIGIDYCMTYDPTILTPTGNVIIGSVVMDSHPDANYAINTTGFPNQVCVSIYYDSSAPPTAEFMGQGEIACIEFEVATGTTQGTITNFSVNNLIESYSTSISENCAIGGTMEYELDNTLATNLTYWNDSNLPLKYDGTTSYLPTYIYGLDNNCIQNGIMGTPNLNGEVQWTSSNGASVYIERDIDNSTNVMTIINGMDNYLLYQVTTLNPLYTPSIYEIMAMDVNQDGSVTAGDITHLSNRIVLNLGEYPQTNPTPTGLTSRDWVFVTDSLAQGLNYTPSISYPFSDGVGYDRLNVPIAPMCLDMHLDGQCFTNTDMNFQGILLGDTDKSWDLSSVQLRTGNEEVEFSIETAEVEDCRLRIPVKVKNGDYVKALDFQLEYNTDKMTYIGTEYGDIDSNDMGKMDNEAQAGEIYFSSYAKNKDGIIPNGIVLYYLIFDLKEDETITTIDLNPKLSLVDGLSARKAIVGTEYSCKKSEADRFTVSPNPFRNGFQIDIDGYGDVEEFIVVLYDAAGKLITKKRFTESLYFFEARYLPEGVYVYELLGDGESLGVGRMIALE